MRLVCSGFWALEPFDGFVDELLATVPADLAWR